MKRAVLPLLAFILAISYELAGQSFYALRRERSLIFFAGTGTSTYFGELSNPGDYLDAKPNLTFGLQHPLFNKISLRGEATWFRLQGDDSKADDESRMRRNLSFRSDNFEVSVSAVVNFFKGGRRFYQRPAINFYAFGGLGLLYFNPTTQYQGTRYSLRPLQTEKVAYARFTPVVPIGFGGKFKVGPLFNIVVEGGYRKTFSDYLDDVSTIHVGAVNFSDPVAAALSDRRPEVNVQPLPAGTKRGNPNSMDGYFLLSAKIEYYLPFDFLSYGNQRSTYQKRKSLYKPKRSPGRRRR